MVARGDQQGVGVLFHHLTECWDVRDDHRQTQRQRFDQGATQALVDRGEHEHVGGGHHVGHVGAVPEEVDRIIETVGDYPLTDPAGSVSLPTDDEQPSLRYLAKDSGESVDQMDMALLVLQPSHRDHDRGRVVDPQISSHRPPPLRCAFADTTRLPTPGHDRDPPGFHPQRRHRRVFDRLADGVEMVGAPSGQQTIDELDETETPDDDVGVGQTGGVVGGVDQVDHYRHRFAHRGDPADQVRLEDRRVHQVRPLLIDQAAEGGDLPPSPLALQEADVESLVHRLGLEPDVTAMEAGNHGTDPGVA